MARALIIDDDPYFCDMLKDMLRELGHEPVTASSLGQGLEKKNQGPFDVALLDVNLPDGNGLSVIPEIRNWRGGPEVIIITGAGSRDGAELAIKNGAWDYLEKSASFSDMSLALCRVLQYRRQKRPAKLLMVLKREGIIGESSQLRACLEMVAQASSTDANVLIHGETGTGKELFARAIHANSRRAQKSFVVVDCASLPETLVEGTLFGYKKGAYTGADRSSEGLVKQADGGTLFLDEVGELPLGAQRAFLRVLQEHRFRPLGGAELIQSDFRVIAATNRDLEAEVKKGAFRNDLFFRLKMIALEAPPLRDRARDIKDIVYYHLNRLCDHYGLGVKGFSPEFLEALLAYSWPGNVRELVNAVEYALATAGLEPTLYPQHLPTDIRVSLVQDSLRSAPSPAGDKSRSGELPAWNDYKEQRLSAAEKDYIEELMSLTQGDIVRAMAVSGLSRSRIYQIKKKYAINLNS